MKTIDVFSRVHGIEYGFLVDMIRQWQLHQNTVHLWVFVQGDDPGHDLVMRCAGVQTVDSRVHPRICRLTFLVTDIDLAGGVFTDQDHGESGCHAMCGF